MSKIIFLDAETTFRHIFLCTNLLCLSRGDPEPFVHSRGIRLLGTHSLPCVGCLNILLAMLLENIDQSRFLTKLQMRMSWTSKRSFRAAVEDMSSLNANFPQR